MKRVYVHWTPWESMEVTYITPGMCNFSYMMTSQAVKTIFCFSMCIARRTIWDTSHENRIIFQNLNPVELKIAKSETFDLFDFIPRKLYITDMQNYTFSKSLCQEECISKSIEKIRSNLKFDSCVTLQKS